MTAWATNPEYSALSAEGQLVHALLLRQPDLSACGVLSWIPGRLLHQVANFTAEQLDAGVQDLIAHQYALFDSGTSEIALRGFLDSDGILSCPNTLKKAAAAWHGIHSGPIRAAIVAELPMQYQGLWPDRLPDRKVVGDEPLPFDPPEGSPQIDASDSNTYSSSLSTPLSPTPPPVDIEVAGTTERAREVQLRIVERRMERARLAGVVFHTSREGYRSTVDKDIAATLTPLARDLFQHDPALSIDAVVCALDPDPTPRVLTPLGCRECQSGWIVPTAGGPVQPCPVCRPARA